MLARLQSRGGVEQVDVLSEHLSAGAKTEGGTSAKEERIAGKEKSKARAWDRAVAAPDDATYVGDTRSDFEAATACGLRFVGVDYGFEALRGAVDAPVAADVDELCALLCGPDR